MPNPFLDSLREQRQHQIAFMDETVSRAAADERDLVEAELSNLAGAKERISKLDAQIQPLAEFEALRDTHETAVSRIVGPRTAAVQQLAGPGRAGAEYASPGAFIVDFMAGRGYMSTRQGQRVAADPEAAARVQYALQNQITTDTPGILPDPVVGQVISLIDATRPLITSIGGARSMGGIPGKSFGRPKITQHVTVGPQAAEKTELPSRKMTIGEVPFTKATYGGAVDVSRQDIDWTSPAAWDILVRDLADVYAIETEAAAAAAFATGASAVNPATAAGSGDLAGLSTALYAAAGLVYGSSKRLPDRIWMSTDVWGTVGPALDTACCSQPQGSSSFASFSGNLYGVARIVVPSFPAGTLIVGAASAFEVYEEAIGLLTAVEPSLLGVEVAYGGYIAFNYVAAEAVAPITPFVAPPLADGQSGRNRDR